MILLVVPFGRMLHCPFSQQIEGNQTVALGGDTSPWTASTFLDSEVNQLALPSARFAIAPAFQSLRQPGCPVNVEPVLQSRWFYKWLHWKDRLKDSGGNHSPVVDHFGM